MQIDPGPFGADRLWPALAAAIFVLVAWQLLMPPAPPDKETALLNVVEGGVATVRKISRSDCQQQTDRIWVVVEDGVDCIAYATAGPVANAAVVLVFLNGDVTGNQLGALASSTALAQERKTAERWAAQYDVPVVIVGRPGLLGSTGLHLLGGRRDEAHVIEDALAGLQERFGFRRLALAGQSGGARIIAQLMVLGRLDIACAAMGSGAYDVPGTRGGGRQDTNIFGDPGRRYLVPLREIARIPMVADRRSFVIADREDKISPFDEQRAWATKLGTTGHHVRLIEVQARDDQRHGTARFSVAAAAHCAKGSSDDRIATALSTL